jgi:hypothetical protein
MRAYAAALIFGLVAHHAAASADAPDAETVQLLGANSLPISVNSDGSFSGPGWQKLVTESLAAGIVVLGEQHATADIPSLAVRLHAAMRADAAAIEVGPWSTRFALELIRSGAGKLESWQARKGNGFALPFLFFSEESRAAEAMAAQGSADIAPLWGLDQEFVGAGAVLFPLLLREAGTNDQRAAVEALVRAQEKDPMSVGALTEAQIEPLERTFAVSGTGAKIVEALKVTNRIYAPYTRRSGSYYAANLERETYMKSNFVVAFDKAEKSLGRTPRVLVKLGGNHAMRYASNTNVPAFGNFAMEWGGSRNIGVMNIMVDCAGGQLRSPQSAKPEPCQPLAPDAAALNAVERRGRMTLIDLRPAREALGRLKSIDAPTKRVVLGFDYYLVIADVRPATSIGSAASPSSDASAPAARQSARR